MAKAKSSSSDQTWLIWSIAHCPTSIWASKFLFLYSNLWGRFVLGEQVLDKRVAIRELSLCRCTLCGQHFSLLEVQKNLDELRDRRSKIGHFAAQLWKVKSHYIISGRVKEDPSGTAFLLNPPDHCWHNRLLRHIWERDLAALWNGNIEIFCHFNSSNAYKLPARVLLIILAICKKDNFVGKGYISMVFISTV